MGHVNWSYFSIFNLQNAYIWLIINKPTVHQPAEKETCLCSSLHLDVEVRLTYALTSLTSFLKSEAYFVAHDTLGHVYRLKYEPISRNWKPLPKKKKKTKDKRAALLQIQIVSVYCHWKIMTCILCSNQEARLCDSSLFSPHPSLLSFYQHSRFHSHLRLK